MQVSKANFEGQKFGVIAVNNMSVINFRIYNESFFLFDCFKIEYIHLVFFICMAAKMTSKRRVEKKTLNENSEEDHDNQMNDHLANERTFLSWTRTGLNIFTVGCAIGRFGGSLNSTATSLTSPNAQKKPLIAGIILAGVGILCLIYGIWRFFRTHRRIIGKRASDNPDILGPIISVFVLMGALIAVLIIFFIL
jgi:putative membrane protein